MKKLLAAAAVFTALATPALAQGVRVQVDDGMTRERHVETVRHHPGHHYGWRHNRWRGCRVITTRTVRPNGSVVIRKVRRCG